MVRKPSVGVDANTWGTILNEFLDVEHNADGTLKNPATPLTDAAINTTATTLNAKVARTYPATVGADGQVLGKASGVPAWVTVSGGGGAGTRTIIVAAANASSRWTTIADYTCTGTADEVKINAAIAALPAAGGDVVLSEGLFTISTPVRVKSQTRLRGQGRLATTLQLANATNQTVIKGLNATAAAPTIGARVSDLTLDGNKANQTDATDSYGMSLYSANDCVAERIRVVNTVRSGIFFAGARNSARDCVIDGAGLAGGSIVGKGGIVFSDDGTTYPVQSYARGNRISNVQEHGIKIYPGGHRSRMIGNDIDGSGLSGNAGRAIHIQSADKCVVSGNTINGSAIGIVIGVAGGCRGTAISGNTVTGSTAGHGIHLFQCTDTTVTGNALIDNTGYGLYIEQGNGLAIGSNTCSGNGSNNTYGSTGITIVNATDGAVTGNVCKNNGNSANAASSAGIWVWSTSTVPVNWSITGNRCYDDRATRLQSYGIKVSNASDYLIIIGNTLRGNLTSSLNMAGTGANNVTTPNIV